MGTLGRAFYTVGFWIRETGQAIDRLGSRLQGNYFFQEQRTFHFSILIHLFVSGYRFCIIRVSNSKGIASVIDYDFVLIEIQCQGIDL